MKKIICFLFTLVLFLCALTFSSFAYENEEFYKGAKKGEVINVFNWGEYISDTAEDGLVNVNEEFERLTGIKVNYVTFESNEDMYAKIKNGGASYDIIIPSDYMIERMINEGLVQKYDPTKLPNYKYIDSKYKGMYYDENNEYSVPYNVGMVGLIYNSKVVTEKPDSWKVMWDERYSGKILMIDNPRDAFAIAQKIFGYSLNTTDEKELGDCASLLVEQKPLLQSYVMDEVFNKMESGDAAIAPYYVGDYISMKEINPDLEFVYPKEGVNIFVDAVCIPKTAQNVDAALKYINFLLDPQVAFSNAVYIGYATPNTAVLEMEEYAEYAENKLLYPGDDEMPETEYFHNLSQEALTMLSDLWNDVKVAGSSNKHIYVGFGVVGAIVLIYAVYDIAKKKKREYWYDFPKE